MPNAQDQAFTIVARQRGIVTPLERAEALRREMGSDEPVAQVLLKGQLVPPEVVASVLRDLARRTFTCEKCDGRVAWDGLANLDALTCPRCGSALALGPAPDPVSGPYAAVARPAPTGRHGALGAPAPSSGGYPAVRPPIPSGYAPSVPRPTSAVGPSPRHSRAPGGTTTSRPGPGGPAAHGQSTHGSAVGRVPAPQPPQPPAQPPPQREGDGSGALVRPTWTVEETVLDRRRRRPDVGLPAASPAPATGSGVGRATGSAPAAGRATGSMPAVRPPPPQPSGVSPLTAPTAAEGTGRWDAEETVLDKNRKKKAAEQQKDVTDTVRDDNGPIVIPRPSSDQGKLEQNTCETVRDDTVLRPPLQEGSKLGAYTILAELGRGASGVIYLAKRQGLERRFALKVLQHGEGPMDEKIVARFQREAQVASRIEDPGIIGVFDVGREGDIYYYAMDYVPGQTLEERLQGGPLPARDAAEVILRLARSMHVAHEHGVIHRDLKPPNVIVDEVSGRPRITDFGVARDQSLLGSFTRTGELLGTPTHMAPEQLLGEATIDRRVDIYALGVILYECLTGKPPFEGPTAIAVAEKACSTDPVPPRVHYPDLPRDLERICLRAMARDRARRYPFASELADDLQRFLDGAPPVGPSSGGARVPQVPRWALAAAGGSLLLAVGALLLRAALSSGAADPGASAAPVVEDATLQAQLDQLRSRLSRARPEDLARIEADLTSLSARHAADRVPQLAQLEAELAVRQLLEQSRARARAREMPGVVLPLLDKAAGAARGDAALRALVQLERTGFLRRRGRLEDATAASEELLHEKGRVALLVRVERALVQQLQGRPDEVRRTLIKLREMDGSGALGRLATAWESWLDQRIAPGVEAANRALGLEPDQVMALVLCARLENIAGGSPDTVDRRLARAEDLAPDDPEVYAAKCEVAHTRGDYHAALAAIEIAIDLCNPQPPRDYLYWRGIVQLRLGIHDKAVQDLSKALAARLDLQALFWRGIALLAQGNNEAGLDDLRRAESLDPGGFERLKEKLDERLRRQLRATSGPRQPETQELDRTVAARLAERAARASEPARAGLEAALRAAVQGLPAAEVMDVLQGAARAAPTDPVVALERARLLVGRDLREPARQAIDAARKGGANELELLFLDAELALRAGRQGEGQARLAELITRGRGGALGQCARARTLLLEGEAAGAQTSADLGVHMSEGTNAACHRVQAEVLLQLGKPAEAVAAAQRGVAVEGSLDAFLHLTLLRARTQALVDRQGAGDSVAAVIRDLERVIELSPAATGIRLEASLIALLLSRTGGEEVERWGRRELEKAGQAAREDPQLFLVRGAWALEAGAPGECLAAWRRARELDRAVRPPLELLRRFRQKAPASGAELDALLRD